ncbi:MAG: hypothetical protein ACYDBV_15075 [Nitrospiria bacterium]
MAFDFDDVLVRMARREDARVLRQYHPRADAIIEQLRVKGFTVMALCVSNWWYYTDDVRKDIKLQELEKEMEKLVNLSDRNET